MNRKIILIITLVFIPQDQSSSRIYCSSWVFFFVFTFLDLISEMLIQLAKEFDNI
jgi:hypothetical protein